MSKRPKKVRRLAERYRVERGERFRLADVDPGDTAWLASKEGASEALAAGVARLAELQERLYAQDRWALLLVFQAMDAAGKDSTIEHVMSGVNPQGCHVVSFKAPSVEELDHDFLWRCARHLPERGRIGIFNRSHYEEVLAVRVHPEYLERQRLPPGASGKRLWKERFEDIVAWERYLVHNGVAIRKFFLHVSKEEQRQRFLARLERPEKNWKFSLADVDERERFDDYMKAYESAIRHTATAEAPWYVVPADNKWFTRLVVADAVADALESLRPEFPVVDESRRAELEAARVRLEIEGLAARR